MTRPGMTRWATNSLWAGGPDAGQPTKAQPTAGGRAEGRYASYRPAPQVWNFERWELGRKIEAIDFGRVANWEFCDPTALGIAAMTNCMGHYEPTTETSVLYWGDVAGPWNGEEFAVGSLVWAAGGAVAGGAASVPSASHDGTGDRAWVDRNPLNGVQYSVAFGAWGVPGAWIATIGTNWYQVYHDNAGLWVIGDNAGNLQQTAGPGIAFAAPPTPPGFGANPVVVIRHSRHPAATIFPQDPGNPTWLAMTTTQVSRSANGLVWTAAAAHGIPGTPVDADYSAYGARWIAVSTAAGANVYISDDNGATWAGAAIGSALAPTIIRIASDGFGHWVVAIGDVGPPAVVEIWASVDNGDNFSRIYTMPDAAGNQPFPNALDVWYGGGRFVLYSDDGGGNNAIFTSLRMDE